MNNPFDAIYSQLANIENLLKASLANKNQTPQEHTFFSKSGKRLADTNGTAKYLKCPRAQVYQLHHKDIIKGKTLPGSRRLYFDLDEIDAAFQNVTAKA